MGRRWDLGMAASRMMGGGRLQVGVAASRNRKGTGFERIFTGGGGDVYIVDDGIYVYKWHEACPILSTYSYRSVFICLRGFLIIIPPPSPRPIDYSPTDNSPKTQLHL